MKNDSTNPAYEEVQIGDIIRERDGMLGIIVGTPGYYHVDVLYADCTRVVGSRLSARKAELSKSENYAAHYRSGRVGMLREWFELWDKVPDRA